MLKGNYIFFIVEMGVLVPCMDLLGLPGSKEGPAS